jgi:hypothetical protein
VAADPTARTETGRARPWLKGVTPFYGKEIAETKVVQAEATQAGSKRLHNIVHFQTNTVADLLKKVTGGAQDVR